MFAVVHSPAYKLDFSPFDPDAPLRAPTRQPSVPARSSHSYRLRPSTVPDPRQGQACENKRYPARWPQHQQAPSRPQTVQEQRLSTHRRPAHLRDSRPFLSGPTPGCLQLDPESLARTRCAWKPERVTPSLSQPRIPATFLHPQLEDTSPHRFVPVQRSAALTPFERRIGRSAVRSVRKYKTRDAAVRGRANEEPPSQFVLTKQFIAAPKRTLSSCGGSRRWMQQYQVTEVPDLVAEVPHAVTFAAAVQVHGWDSPANSAIVDADAHELLQELREMREDINNPRGAELAEADPSVAAMPEETQSMDETVTSESSKCQPAVINQPSSCYPAAMNALTSCQPPAEKEPINSQPAAPDKPVDLQATATDEPNNCHSRPELLSSVSRANLSSGSPSTGSPEQIEAWREF